MLLAATASREYFQYITDKRQRRLGVNVWLALALTVTEVRAARHAAGRWVLTHNNNCAGLWHQLAITVKFHDGFLTLSTFPGACVCVRALV